MLQIVVPPLPGKALSRQLPFRGDDGIFEEDFIEERRKGLEQFINKSVENLSELILYLCTE
jgi:sorting nexin-3/12